MLFQGITCLRPDEIKTWHAHLLQTHLHQTLNKSSIPLENLMFSKPISLLAYGEPTCRPHTQQVGGVSRIYITCTGIVIRTWSKCNTLHVQDVGHGREGQLEYTVHSFGSLGTIVIMCTCRLAFQLSLFQEKCLVHTNSRMAAIHAESLISLINS